MSGRTYAGRCPVHQSVLKTDHTKKFCIKKSGAIYDAPIFFCEKCKTYYVFIKELEESFKGAAKASDGNPIKVLGTKSVVKPVQEIKNTIVISKKPATATKHNLTETKKKQKIVRSIEDGVLTVNITPPRTKVPKFCPKCGAATSNLIFKIVDIKGKEKQLFGKECLSCGSIYYTESIVNQHPRCFSQGGTPQEKKKYEIRESVKADTEEKSEACKPSPQELMEKQEQKKKKEIFSTFCPEHGIVLRTPVMWRPEVPLFSCPQCEKYYVSSNLYPYGIVVGKFRARPIINVNIMVTKGPEPEHKKKDDIEEQIDSKNRESLKNINDDKSIISSINLDIDSDDKPLLDEKVEDHKTVEAESQEHTERNIRVSEPQRNIKISEISQWHGLEMRLARKMYTDDFGVEFDFSELESILLL